jgi:hypothetical protein
MAQNNCFIIVLREGVQCKRIQQLEIWMVYSCENLTPSWDPITTKSVVKLSKSLRRWSHVNQNNPAINHEQIDYFVPTCNFTSFCLIDAKKNTLGESLHFITTQYLYSYQIISLQEAWCKVQWLANFVKIDWDPWHSLAAPTILGGCLKRIISKTLIFDSSWCNGGVFSGCVRMSPQAGLRLSYGIE